MIKRIESEVVFDVYCYTCDNMVSDFVIITPPQWIDPKHEETKYICLDCAGKIGDAAKTERTGEDKES